VTVLRFTVKGDPKPKGRPRAGNGFIYTPPETRRAENTVKLAAKLAKARPLHGPLSVELRFFRATKRRCDLDNLSKLCLDALNGIAYRDDDQIVSLAASKSHDPTNPRTEVTVQPHPPPEAQDWTEADELAEAAHLEWLRRTKGEEPA